MVRWSGLSEAVSMHWLKINAAKQQQSSSVNPPSLEDGITQRVNEIEIRTSST